MRVPSRRLPPAPVPVPTRTMRIVGRSFLVFFGMGLLWAAVEIVRVMCLCPLGALAAVVAVAGLGWVVSHADDLPRDRTKQLRKERAGEGICRFAREFDCRTVDTWLVRAVFAEVRACCGNHRGEPFPVRSDDDLGRDLGLDGLDVEEIVGTVAARAGYALTDRKRNPMHGKVRTVGDLVAFMRHQPCLRVA